MRDPMRDVRDLGHGPRSDAGFECGSPVLLLNPELPQGFKAGSGTSCIIRTSMWDPVRSPGSGAGSGVPCRVQRGVRDRVRGPASRAGPDRQSPRILGEASHDIFMVTELWDEPAVRS